MKRTHYVFFALFFFTASCGNIISSKKDKSKSDSTEKSGGSDTNEGQDDADGNGDGETDGENGASTAADQSGGEQSFLPPTYTMSSGSERSCAIVEGQKLRCWGNTRFGLGYGNQNNIGNDETPASAGDVDVGGEVKQVAVGGQHICALMVNGKVRCWGMGSSTSLGYETYKKPESPPATNGDVPELKDAIQIASGSSYSCALLTDGNISCWGADHKSDAHIPGENSGGAGGSALPTGPANRRIIDFDVDVKQISAGANHACALLANKKVRCWGSNGDGELGYATKTGISDAVASTIAKDIDVGGDVDQIVAGSRWTCALLVGGKVRCWGRNNGSYVGKSGVGADTTPASAGDVDLGGYVRQLAMGDAHACAILGTNNVRCWGYGARGQLGTGSSITTTEGATPAQTTVVDLGGAARLLSLGDHFSCAVKPDGAVLCWGQNSTGALGYGHIETIGDDEAPSKAGPITLGAKVLLP